MVLSITKQLVGKSTFNNQMGKEAWEEEMEEGKWRKSRPQVLPLGRLLVLASLGGKKGNEKSESLIFIFAL